MAGEAGTEDTQVLEQDDAQADADFDSGFTPAAQTPTPDALVDDTEAKTAVDAPAAPAPAPEPPKLAEITQAQFEELVQKAGRLDQIETETKSNFDKAFGQLGGLKQSLDAMRAATPAGQAIELSDDDFADMQAVFPELVDSLKPVLKKALSKFHGAAPDGAVLDELVGKKLAEPLAQFREAQIESLNDILPEWQNKVRWREKGGDGVFEDWFKGQDEKVKALAAVDSPVATARVLRLFRDRPKDAPKPAPAAPAAPAAPNTRTRQLQAAVNPRSSGAVSTAPSDDDEFDAGFKSASAR